LALAWLQVGYTGIVTTSIAYLAFAWGARNLPPTSAVFGTLGEPLAAAILAAWLWNQQLTARQYAGATDNSGHLTLNTIFENRPWKSKLIFSTSFGLKPSSMTSR